jgi:4-cresol dehydrogenase (hydroxylating)
MSVALEQLSRAVGERHVIAEAGEVARRSLDTSWFHAQPSAIVYPATTEEVQAVVRIANERELTLWPYGGGKNWGYGGSLPMKPGAVAVCLSRMNRIVEHDEELAYVVLEAGVTFGQLHAYLRERGSRSWCSTTDSTLEGSVIGNALDRGIGSTPYGDHFANLCGVTAVLPDGTVAEPGSATRYTSRWGLGPYTDGTFGQSNYGIVTQAGMWLMPAPERTLLFAVQGEDMPGMVDALRRLALRETVRSRVKIVNASGVLGYFDGLAGRWAPSARTERELEAARAEHGVARWSMMGAVYGSPAEVRAHRQEVTRELAGLGKLEFVRLDKVAALESLLARLERPSRFGVVQRGVEAVVRRTFGASLTLLKAQPHNFRLWAGEPTEKNIAFAYARAGRPAPSQDLDPARDGCGKVWFSPLLPLRGSDASRVLAIAEPLYARHGFDFNTYLVSMSARSLVLLMSIVYSKTEPGEEARARALYEDLSREVRRAGYEPYRTGPWATPEVPAFARTIKRALDPAGVLAPGKYGV